MMRAVGGQYTQADHEVVYPFRPQDGSKTARDRSLPERKTPAVGARAGRAKHVTRGMINYLDREQISTGAPGGHGL